MILRTLAATGCLVLLGGATAFAQPGPPSTGGLFISPAGEPFRQANGSLAALTAWFDGADADHDGKLAFGEFLADHNRFFDIADANKNSVLAGVDVTLYENRIAPEILGPDPAPRPMGRPGSGEPGGKWSTSDDGSDPISGRKPKLKAVESRTGAGRFSLLNEPEPIRAGDGDVDFQVTKAEWASAARRRFDRLDADKDGALTITELQPRLP